MVRDLLAAYVPHKVTADYKEACATWRRILPILTRAGDVATVEMAAFRRDSAAFVDRLIAAFEWTRVTAKLHTLCCHAADFLEMFGSLGRYSEQSLEAWHGHKNQNSRLYTADTFLESCLSYVKSAMARAPGNAAHNRGKRRSPAKAGPGRHHATRLDDKRTRYGKALVNGLSATSQVCWDKQAAECRKWASDNLTVTMHKIDAYRRRAKLPLSEQGEDIYDEESFALGADWDELLEAETACFMNLLQE